MINLTKIKTNLEYRNHNSVYFYSDFNLVVPYSSIYYFYVVTNINNKCKISKYKTLINCSINKFF